MGVGVIVETRLRVVVVARGLVILVGRGVRSCTTTQNETLKEILPPSPEHRSSWVEAAAWVLERRGAGSYLRGCHPFVLRLRGAPWRGGP